MAQRKNRYLSGLGRAAAVDLRRTPLDVAQLAGRSETRRSPVLEMLEARRLLSIEVYAGATLIENGETLARDFGFEQAGNEARVREYRVENTGDGAVTLSGLAVPEGFTIVAGFTDADLAVGESATFQIALDTATDAGAKSGDVTFDYDEGSGATSFLFAAEGELTPAGGPRVVGFFPDNRGGFWVDFDEPLDPSVVDAGGVNAFGHGPDGIVGTLDDTRILGTITYDADRRQLRFSSRVSTEATDYRVELVSNAIYSVTGEQLDGEFAPFEQDGVSGDGVEGGTFNAAVDISELTGLARFDFNVGLIDVALTPDITPITVENFYRYADLGLWDVSFLHRSVPDFVIQGGGFRLVNEADPTDVPEFEPIENEYQEGLTSNTRGTIAMAKLSGNPNSATNQWFFNVADNSDNLDNQNGGFTTFGAIVGAGGLEAMDSINALDTEDLTSLDSAFSQVPVTDVYDGVPLTNDELVTLERLAGGVSFGAVDPEAIVVDISDPAADPQGGVHYVYDFGRVAGEADVEIDIRLQNLGGFAVEVTSATFGDGSAYTLTPANEVGNDEDDWVLVLGQTQDINVSLDTSVFGDYESTLVLVMTEEGVPKSFTMRFTAEVTPPSPVQPDLDPASDTGLVATDNVTRLNNADGDSRLLFDVRGVTAGAIVTIYADDIAIGSGTVDDGATGITIETDGSTLIADGQRVITAVQTIDGQDSVASEGLTITVDSVAPVFNPVENLLAAVDSLYYEDLDTDDETNGVPVFYEPTSLPDGASVNGGTGEVTWTPTIAQLGDHEFQVTARDLAGNTSTVAFTVSVKTAAPAAPDLQAASDTGSSDSDNITSFNNSDDATRLEFLVTDAISGSLITVYADQTAIGTATVPDGATEVAVITDGVTTLADDDYTIRVTQTVDSVESGPSSPLFLTVDSTGPVFEDPEPRDLNASFLNAYELDLNTDDEDALKLVDYVIVSGPDGATIDAITGIISWIPAQDQLGPNDFVVSGTDVAGNVTEYEFTVTVAEAPPAAPQLVAESDTGQSSSDLLTRFDNSSPETALMFRVIDVLPDATVRIYADGVLIGTATVEPGETEVIVTTDGTTALAEGQVNITTTQATDIGETIDSDPLVITIDTTGPAFTEVDPNFAVTATFSNLIDLKTDDEDSGRFVEYDLISAPTGVDLLNSNGRLFWTPTTGQLGDNEFVVSAEDNAGNITEYTFTQFVRSPELAAEGLDIRSGIANEPGRRDFGITPDVSGRITVLLSEPVDGEQFWLRILDNDTLTVLDADRTNSTRPAAITFEAEAGHMYELQVESYQESIGDFVVALRYDTDGRTEDAMPLEFGGVDGYDGNDVMSVTVGGRDIINRVDYDYFSFVAPVSGDVDLSLFNADGLRGVIALVQDTVDGEVVLGEATAPQIDGTAVLEAELVDGEVYYVRVTSQSEATTGRFGLSIAADAEFTEDNPLNIGVLEASLNTRGTIEPPTDKDWFQFTADQDGAVLFNSTGSFTLSLDMTIVDVTTGQQVARATESGRIQPYGRFEVLEGRAYRIKAVSIGNSWGDYTITLAYDDLGDRSTAEQLDLTPAPQGSESDAMVAETDNGITALLDEDWFSFVAPVDGGQYTFSLTSTPGLLQPKVTIYTARGDGSLRQERGFQDSLASGQVGGVDVLRPGATYFIEVEALPNSFLGDYTLRMEIDGNGSPESADDLGSLTTETTAVVGATANVDDLDYFRFTTPTQSWVLIDLVPGGPDAKIRIYDANTGKQLSVIKERRNRPAQERLPAVAGGAYLLRVESHKKQIGDYTINVGLDDLGTANEAAAMEFEVSELYSETDPLLAQVSGTIGSTLDQDFYTFIAPTGASSAYFSIESTPSELFGEATLYRRSPNGGLQKVGRAKDRQGVGFEDMRVNLIPGAQYFLGVESIRGKSSGDYTIRAEIDYNATFATADNVGTITEDTTIEGFALDRKDVDVFRFTAGSDGVLHMLMQGGPFLTADVELYSVNDTSRPVLKDKRKPGQTVAWTRNVTAGDEFYLVIEPRGRDAAGPYTFDLSYEPIIP
jgi:cyclophilin family peptidyl-prolyl cis-trans isomerase